MLSSSHVLRRRERSTHIHRTGIHIVCGLEGGREGGREGAEWCIPRFSGLHVFVKDLSHPRKEDHSTIAKHAMQEELNNDKIHILIHDFMSCL